MDEDKIKEGLDLIRAEEQSEIISASIILGIFRKAGDSASFSLDDLAEKVSDGKWFKKGEEIDSSYLNKTLGFLQKYKLLFKYPDGKYIYRLFD